MVVWTGLLPTGLYATRSSEWQLTVPTCSNSSRLLPSVQHSFPLWATVEVHWFASSGPVWFLTEGSGEAGVSQAGTNGSASFVSDSYPIAFTVESLGFGNPPTGCPPETVLLHVTYTG